MAINFPSSPTTGQVYEYQSIRWRWNGSAWDKYEVFTFNGLTANVEGVGSWNGLTGAVTGVTTSVANIFVPLQTFNSGISAYGASFDGGPVTVQGNIVWHAGNDGATSALDAGLLYGVSGSVYASSLSTGLLYGGLLSINAGNTATFDITAGSGYIVTTGATFTALPNPVITRVNWTAKTGVTLSGLSSQDTTWVYVDSTGTIQQQATFFTDDQVNSTIALGALVHPSRSYISLAKTIPNVSYATDKQYEQFIRAFGPMKVSGHTIQANDGNLRLNRTNGTAFILGRNYPNDPNNPSVVSDIAKTDAEIWRYYRGITAGSFVTVTGITTGIDPTSYDDGTGILHAVSPSTPFTIQRVFFFPGTPNVLGVYYGRSQYASLSEAANNIHLEDFTEITNTATNAILAAFIIVKYNVTNLDTAIAANNARIIQAGQFRTTSSGGGSVATNLDSLSDVVISGAQDDDVLIYDTATSQWLNTPLSHIGVTRFNGLTGTVTGVGSFNGSTGTVVFSNYVSAFNGLTGAVSGVTTSVANTFTALQTFNAGITSAGATFTGNVAMTSTSSHTGLASFAGGITSSGATFTGQVTVTNFKANTIGGDEGGQIDFGLAATNTSLTGGVAIDIYQDKVRIFETGGTNRGTFIDLTGAGTGVGSDLLTRVTIAPPGFTSAINTFNDSTNNGSKTIYYLSPMYKAYANYGSYTVKANRTYFTLFSTNKPVTIKTIRSVTNNTVTTGNCYLSVYSADSTTGLPKTILYSSASLAVGSGYGGASVTNASGLVTVPAGHFYLAATYSSTPIVFGYYRYTVDGVFGSSSYSAGPFNMMPIADYTGFTAGSLPASGVTLSYLENSAGNYLGPVIDFAVV